MGHFRRANPGHFSQASKIGEAITLEVASRLPMIASRELGCHAPRQAERIARILEDLDNIRPVTAIFKWIKEETAGLSASVLKTLDDVVAAVFKDFSNIRFVEEWSRRIDQRFIPDDAPWFVKRWAQVVDRDFHEWIRGIKSVRGASDLLDRGTAADMDIYERVKEFTRYSFRATVLDHDVDFSKARAERRFYVYGHTHVPLVVPLAGGASEQLLINTGTFRPRFVAAGDRNAVGGFIGQRTMSFAVIYRKGELSSAGHQKSYELWSGLSER